jgi:molybdopterin molybdotransferase
MDEKDEIERLLRAALPNDIVIVCGGVSAGDADYTPEVLTRLGAKKIFHKVAIRPGKPVWFGNFDEGAVVFALPGNPFSCMVTFKIFIELFLIHSFGLGNRSGLELPLNGSRSKKNVLDEFFPVMISGSPSCLDIISFNGSGDITASIGAQAIARHPAELEHISEGTILTCYPLV